MVCLPVICEAKSPFETRLSPVSSIASFSVKQIDGQSLQVQHRLLQTCKTLHVEEEFPSPQPAIGLASYSTSVPECELPRFLAVV